MSELDVIYRLRVDAAQAVAEAKAAAGAVDQVGAAAGRASSQVKRITPAMDEAAKAARQSRSNMQAFSFQMQDILITSRDVPSTLNAIGVQGGQLASSIAGLNPMIGLYVTLAGLAASALVRWLSSSEDMADANKKLEESQKNLNAMLELAETPLDKMIDKYGSLHGIVADMGATMAAAEIVVAMQAQSDAMEAFSESAAAETKNLESMLKVRDNLLASRPEGYIQDTSLDEPGDAERRAALNKIVAAAPAAIAASSVITDDTKSYEERLKAANEWTRVMVTSGAINTQQAREALAFVQAEIVSFQTLIKLQTQLNANAFKSDPTVIAGANALADAWKSAVSFSTEYAALQKQQTENAKALLPYAQKLESLQITWDDRGLDDAQKALNQVLAGIWTWEQEQLKVNALTKMTPEAIQEAATGIRDTADAMRDAADEAANLATNIKVWDEAAALRKKAADDLANTKFEVKIHFMSNDDQAVARALQQINLMEAAWYKIVSPTSIIGKIVKNMADDARASTEESLRLKQAMADWDSLVKGVKDHMDDLRGYIRDSLGPASDLGGFLIGALDAFDTFKAGYDRWVLNKSDLAPKESPRPKPNPFADTETPDKEWIEAEEAAKKYADELASMKFEATIHWKSDADQELARTLRQIDLMEQAWLSAAGVTADEAQHARDIAAAARDAAIEAGNLKAAMDEWDRLVQAVKDNLDDIPQAIRDTLGPASRLADILIAAMGAFSWMKDLYDTVTGNKGSPLAPTSGLASHAPPEHDMDFDLPDSTGGGGGKSAAESKKDLEKFIADTQLAYDHQMKLTEASKMGKAAHDALMDSYAKSDAIKEATEKMLELATAAGMPKDQIEELRKKITQLAGDTVDAAQKMDKALNQDLAGNLDAQFNQSLQDGVDLIIKQEGSFKEWARSFLQQISSMIAKQIVLNTIQMAFGAGGGPFAMFSSFLGNMGGSGGGPTVTKFASGGIISGPTPFSMSGGGMGLAGEAGPEAIMPLTRGANGKLGVAGAQPKIVINNYAGAQVSVTRSSDEIIEIAVQQSRKAVEKDFSASMRSGYGSYSEPINSTYRTRRKLG